MSNCVMPLLTVNCVLEFSQKEYKWIQNCVANCLRIWFILQVNYVISLCFLPNARSYTLDMIVQCTLLHTKMNSLLLLLHWLRHNVTGTWEGRLTKIIKHAAYYGLYPLVVCSGDKEPVASPRGGLGGHVHPTFAPEIDMNPTSFYRGGVGGSRVASRPLL